MISIINTMVSFFVFRFCLIILMMLAPFIGLVVVINQFRRLICKYTH